MTFSVSLWATRKVNAGAAAEEMLPASLVGLKKCSRVDISLQSPRYVSSKTRYEAAKRLPRVEVAKGACYAIQCLCVAMYKRHPQMGNVRKLYSHEHYVIRENVCLAKISKYTVMCHRRITGAEEAF